MKKVALISLGAILLAFAAGSLGQAAPLPGATAYIRGDYAAAAKRMWPLAERGNAKAQTYLGFMYANGRGVPQDYVDAVYWYRRAAEQGNPDAQCMLGLMYDKGHGVPREFIVAHKWLNLAAARATGKERDYYVRLRNAVAFKMSPAQISEAQWLAHEWRPKPERLVVVVEQRQRFLSRAK
jgi:TPR repeat protein